MGNSAVKHERDIARMAKLIQNADMYNKTTSRIFENGIINIGRFYIWFEFSKAVRRNFIPVQQEAMQQYFMQWWHILNQALPAWTFTSSMMLLEWNSTAMEQDDGIL